MNNGSSHPPFQSVPVATSISPEVSAPRTLTYKADVSRTKTRKWVEAKRTNYDGDDWGGGGDDEDYEDDDLNTPPPLAPRQLQPQPPYQRALQASSSRSNPPLARSASGYGQAAPPAVTTIQASPALSSPRGFSSIGPLHIQTPPNHQPAPHQYLSQNASAIEMTSPVGSGRSSSGSWDRSIADTFSPTKHQSTMNAFLMLQQQQQQQQKQNMAMNMAMADKKHSPADADPARPPTRRGTGDLDAGSTGRPGSSYGGGPNSFRDRTPSIGRRPSAESLNGAQQSELNRGLRYNLSPVAERGSEYGFDRIAANALRPLGNAPPVASSSAAAAAAPVAVGPTPGSLQGATVALQRSASATEDSSRLALGQQRLSSPRLPDLTRMSGFGEDFFGISRSGLLSKSWDPPPPAGSFDSDSRSSPKLDLGFNLDVNSDKPAHPESASTPPSSMVASTTQPSNLTTQATTASTTAYANDPVAGQSPPDPSHNPEFRKLPPLQTTTSGLSHLDADMSASQYSATASTKDSMLPAPLQPRPADYSPSTYDAPDFIQRASTYSSMATSSPVKESDKLREEIMKSLSPVQPARAGDRASDEERHNERPAEVDGAQESPHRPGEPSPQHGSDIGDNGSKSSPRAVSPAVSDQANMATPKQGSADLGIPEPPSPVSVLSDNRIHADPPKAVSPMPASEELAARPATSHLNLSKLGNVVIPQFNEIAHLSDPAERIAKYKAAGQHMATFDTGLGTWLAIMKERRPEYADVFEQNGQMPRPLTAQQHQGGGSGGLRHHQSQPHLRPGYPSGQIGFGDQTQPYYQQFLNASNPALGGVPGAGRPGSAAGAGAGAAGSGGAGAGVGASVGAAATAPGPFGRMPPPGAAAGAPPASDFRHGNHVGARSKEFLGAAAKAGKGLFSKGRSKLRGATDKKDKGKDKETDPHGAPLQPVISAQFKAKPDRRTSWSISTLTKSSRHAHNNSNNSSGAVGFGGDPMGPQIQHLGGGKEPPPRPPRPSYEANKAAALAAAEQREREQQDAASGQQQNQQGAEGMGLGPAGAPPMPLLPGNLEQKMQMQTQQPPQAQPAQQVHQSHQVQQQLPPTSAAGGQWPSPSMGLGSPRKAQFPPGVQAPPEPAHGLGVVGAAVDANEEGLSRRAPHPFPQYMAAPHREKPSAWSPIQEEGSELEEGAEVGAEVGPRDGPQTEAKEGWVVVDKPGQGQQQSDGQDQAPPEEQTHESEGTGTMSSTDEPFHFKRHESFVGLPPIRRTSTFSTLGMQMSRHAADDAPPVPPLPAGVTAAPTTAAPAPMPMPEWSAHGPPPAQHRNQPQNHPTFDDTDDEGATLFAIPPRPRSGKGDRPFPRDSTISVQTFSIHQDLEDLEERDHQKVGGGWSNPNLSLHLGRRASRGAVKGAGAEDDDEPTPRAQQVPETIQEAATPLQADSNAGAFLAPIQSQGLGQTSFQPPPAGWKLEESHLQEPLHMTRNRGGSSASPPQHSPQHAPSPTVQRFFGEQQQQQQQQLTRQYSDRRPQQPYPSQQRSFSAQGTYDTPNQSLEQQSMDSGMALHQEPEHMHPDGASESSVPTEDARAGKKRRNSLFMSLRGGPRGDAGLKVKVDVGQAAAGVGPASTTPTSFSPLAGASPGSFKGAPGQQGHQWPLGHRKNMSTSSAGSMPVEPGSAGSPVVGPPSAGQFPAAPRQFKKRLSGLTERWAGKNEGGGGSGGEVSSEASGAAAMQQGLPSQQPQPFSPQPFSPPQPAEQPGQPPQSQPPQPPQAAAAAAAEPQPRQQQQQQPQPKLMPQGTPQGVSLGTPGFDAVDRPGAVSSATASAASVGVGVGGPPNHAEEPVMFKKEKRNLLGIFGKMAKSSHVSKGSAGTIESLPLTRAQSSLEMRESAQHGQQNQEPLVRSSADQPLASARFSASTSVYSQASTARTPQSADTPSSPGRSAPQTQAQTQQIREHRDTASPTPQPLPGHESTADDGQQPFQRGPSPRPGGLAGASRWYHGRAATAPSIPSPLLPTSASNAPQAASRFEKASKGFLGAFKRSSPRHAHHQIHQALHTPPMRSPSLLSNASGTPTAPAGPPTPPIGGMQQVQYQPLQQQRLQQVLPQVPQAPVQEPPQEPLQGPPQGQGQEPTYQPVNIPAAYNAVHGDGAVAARSPYDVSSSQFSSPRTPGFVDTGASPSPAEQPQAPISTEMQPQPQGQVLGAPAGVVRSASYSSSSTPPEGVTRSASYSSATHAGLQPPKGSGNHQVIRRKPSNASYASSGATAKPEKNSSIPSDTVSPSPSHSPSHPPAPSPLPTPTPNFTTAPTSPLPQPPQDAPLLFVHDKAQEEKIPLDEEAVELENERKLAAKREAAAMAEEKIPVDGRVEVEEAAVMSATSYPGQEWNPYEAMDWDGDD